MLEMGKEHGKSYRGFEADNDKCVPQAEAETDGPQQMAVYHASARAAVFYYF
jgi:hypothetical protein